MTHGVMVEAVIDGVYTADPEQYADGPYWSVYCPTERRVIGDSLTRDDADRLADDHCAGRIV